jgi:diacylglycerol kinase family enzyme
MRAVAILNASAGGAGNDQPALAGRIAGAFRERGLEADVRRVAAADLTAAAREAGEASTHALVMAGGDGTVSAGAAALAGSPRPLGVLPLGTRNHFARDVGIPLDLPAAVEVIARGNARAVDVGEIEGRTFINNCSIGLYPEMVVLRDRLREEQGLPKRLATLKASWRNLRRMPLQRLSLVLPGRTWTLTTPLVFVGNNRYGTAAFGRREGLDLGELCLYVARPAGRWGLFGLAARALLGRVEAARDLESVCLPALEVRSARRHLRVAVDGEVLDLGRHVRCRVRPRALRVLAPDPAGA